MINVNGSYHNAIGAGTIANPGSPKWHVISRGSTRSNATKKNTKKHQKSHTSISITEDSIGPTVPVSSTSASFSSSSSVTAVSPSIGKKLLHDNRKNTGMCDLLDSPKRRKVSLSWREDALSPSNDLSMHSADLSDSDNSMETNENEDSNLNEISNLRNRISELENEYKNVLEAIDEAKKSISVEQQRRQELLSKKDALVRRHFNATVLRVKLEMSTKTANGSCPPALNMDMARLYDEATAQEISPEMYNTWIRTRLTDIK